MTRHRNRRPPVPIRALALVLGTVAATATGVAVPAPPLAGALRSVQGTRGPESVPLQEGRLLAPASTAAQGSPVDGITCSPREQVVYHVHTHLAVYVDGVLRPIPAGIGIVEPIGEPTGRGTFDAASRCYYWLHVHTQDGVIHIESPTRRRYTVGQFFDLWRQPLGPGAVGPARGPLHVYVDGHPYRGDPRNIVLGSREDVQIDVGSPVVAPRRVNWSVTGL